FGVDGTSGRLEPDQRHIDPTGGGRRGRAGSRWRGRHPGPFGKLLVATFASHLLPLPWRTSRRDTTGIKHHQEEQMEASPSSTPGLKRSLSVWAAVGLPVAMM